MTTPTAEVYANQPTGTVTSGGTAATTGSQSFTVTAVNAFPIASTTPTPNTVFRIMDPAAPTEIMLVTTAPGGTGTGQAWTVTRAAEGTSAVAHAANWTCVQVVTQGSLQAFKQSDFLGTQTSLVTIGGTTTETGIISFTPATQDQPAAGVVYEFSAYGTIGTTTQGTTTAGGSLGNLTFNIRWGSATGGTLLAGMVTGINGSALITSMGNGGFWIEGYVNCLSATSVVAGISWQAAKAGSPPTTVGGGGASGWTTTTSSPAMAGISISGTGPLTLTAKWSSSAASNSLACAGVAQRVQ